MIKINKVLLIAFIISISCINKSIKPEWIQKGFTHNQDQYNAVGVASWKGNFENTFQAAKNNARAELASTIEVKIISIIESEISEIVLNYDHKTYEKFKKFTTSKVNQSLPETKVKEWWQDKKTKDIWVYVDVPKSIIKQKAKETIQKWKKRHSTKIIIVINEKIDKKMVNSSLTKRIIEDKLLEEGYQVLNFSNEQKKEILSKETKKQIKFVKELGANILIIGNAESDYSSTDSAGTNYSYGNAEIKAIRVSDGEVITGKNISDMKGFGVTSDKSGNYALKEMAKEIAENMKEKLDKYF